MRGEMLAALAEGGSALRAMAPRLVAQADILWAAASPTDFPACDRWVSDEAERVLAVLHSPATPTGRGAGTNRLF